MAKVAETKFSQEFFRKDFLGENRKEAYKKANAWFAKKVLSHDDFVNVHCKFVKDEEQYNKITLILFAVVDSEEEVMKEHCKCCKEFHSSFLLNMDINCSRCTAKGYEKRLQEKAIIKKEYYKDLLKEK